MPLPMKTLREVSTEVGMPEAEIRALVQMGKIRALLKKGVMTFAPDEIAKIKRQRKTIPDSAKKAGAPEPVAPAKTAAAIKPVPPKRPPPRTPPPRTPPVRTPPPRLPPRPADDT